MFRIIRVPKQAASQPEQLGTKPKFWFRDENGERWLFKEGRPNSGDDWSEKVASELCELLGLPHATVDLAVWKDRRGIVTRSFVPQDGRLVLGNELLGKVVKAYPMTRTFRVSQHTVRRVLAILRNPRLQIPIGWSAFPSVENTLDVFVGYLMFDAWIANQDRHHENWGLVITAGGARHLSPSYDHASSLGSNETDENRQDRMRTKDKGRSMDRYVERALSAFYGSLVSSKPLSTLSAFQQAGQISPKATDAWLERLGRISFSDVDEIFAQVPQERITPVAIEFAKRMLELNSHRLLALQGAWT